MQLKKKLMSKLNERKDKGLRIDGSAGGSCGNIISRFNNGLK